MKRPFTGSDEDVRKEFIDALDEAIARIKGSKPCGRTILAEFVQTVLERTLDYTAQQEAFVAAVAKEA